jgi:hypothetical protein
VDDDGRSSGVLCDEEPVTLCRLLGATFPVVSDPDLLPLSRNKSPPPTCCTTPPLISTAPSSPLLVDQSPHTSLPPRLRPLRFPAPCASDGLPRLPNLIQYHGDPVNRADYYTVQEAPVYGIRCRCGRFLHTIRYFTGPGLVTVCCCG